MGNITVSKMRFFFTIYGKHKQEMFTAVHLCIHVVSYTTKEIVQESRAHASDPIF